MAFQTVWGGLSRRPLTFLGLGRLFFFLTGLIILCHISQRRLGQDQLSLKLLKLLDNLNKPFVGPVVNVDAILCKDRS